MVSELFGLPLKPSSWLRACCCCWKPAWESALRPPCWEGKTRQPCPGAGAKGALSKGWTLLLTQQDTLCKHVTTPSTLLDNTIKRQHMVSGGQETQPPSDGGEGTTVQERWEHVLPGFETLTFIPRGSQKACISCRASPPAWEPMKAVTDTPGRTGARGG